MHDYNTIQYKRATLHRIPYTVLLHVPPGDKFQHTSASNTRTVVDPVTGRYQRL